MIYSRTSRFEVAAPIDAAWEVLSDLRQASAIVDPSTPVAMDPPGAVHVATRFVTQPRHGPVFTYEVSALTAPTDIELAVTTVPDHYRGWISMHLAATANGTRVEQRTTLVPTRRLERLVGPLLWLPFLPFIQLKALRMRNALRRYVERRGREVG